MNLLYLLMWLLMIVGFSVARENSRNHIATRSAHLETLTLEIESADVPLTITLTRVDRFLANNFLPVWIATSDPNEEFEKLDIEDKLGEFIFYHDICIKSAFVYFRKRRELQGVIDITYFINGLPIDETKDVHVVKREYIHRMREFGKMRRQHRSVNDTEISRTRRSEKHTIYPEFLIAINYDTFKSIETGSLFPRGVATVSHVLVIYNAVDMLYSLMRSSNIHINIATIVIEGVPMLWKFEPKRQSYSKNHKVFVKNVHQKVSKYFWLKHNYFPRHSFDIIIYHTSSQLLNQNGTLLAGQAYGIAIDYYMFPPTFHRNRQTIVVRDYKTYKHYTSIAHEIAHQFDAEHDGDGLHADLFDKESCPISLMAKVDSCEKSCLTWSRQTEKDIQNYLSNTLSLCDLKNIPRSLHPPRPNPVLTAHIQCECYLLKSPLEIEESIREEDCRKPLSCMTRTTGRIEEAPLPMDGTLCGPKKVCWNGVCVQY